MVVVVGKDVCSFSRAPGSHFTIRDRTVTILCVDNEVPREAREALEKATSLGVQAGKVTRSDFGDGVIRPTWFFLLPLDAL